MKTPEELIELVKANEAQFLSARLAPVLLDLEKSVVLRLMTWGEIANRLGVPLNSLRTARIGAKKLLEKWEAAGIAPASFVQASTPAPAAPVAAPAARNTPAPAVTLDPAPGEPVAAPVSSFWERKRLESKGNGNDNELDDIEILKREDKKRRERIGE